MNPTRIKGVILEHLYHLRRSIEDITDTFFWPTMDLIIWGLMTTYFAGLSGTLPQIITFLIGGLLLWNVVWRVQQDISIALLRDVWNRNIINLFSTPLSPWEFLAGTIFLGMIKILLTMGLVSLLAWILWAFDIFRLGLVLIPFFANLMFFAWSAGIVITGLIIRFGMRIQSFAWSLILLAHPLSAVFYPLATLPPALQTVAWFLPTAHIFEGMRQVLAGGGLPGEHLAWAMALNVFYLAGAVFFFNSLFEQARVNGALTRLAGE
ncbi:MAG: ABC transporter permease [Chloroflexi bacterium]|nr:ABC transporter permease [Chloroflexota bacterium]